MKKFFIWQPKYGMLKHIAANLAEHQDQEDWIWTDNQDVLFEFDKRGKIDLSEIYLSGESNISRFYQKVFSDHEPLLMSAFETKLLCFEHAMIGTATEIGLNRPDLRLEFPTFVLKRMNLPAVGTLEAEVTYISRKVSDENMQKIADTQNIKHQTAFLITKGITIHLER